MAVADLIPSYFTQIFASGDGVTGISYTGEETVLRTHPTIPARNGRIHVAGKSGSEAGAIDGGLLDLATLRLGLWNRLQGVFIKLPNISNISLFAVEEDGITYLMATVASDTMVMDGFSSKWLQPGWNVKVVATGTLNAAGKIHFIFDEWANPIAVAQITTG